MPVYLVAMPARRNIALNLLAFRPNFSWRGFAALWRLVTPAADQKLEISRHP